MPSSSSSSDRLVKVAWAPNQMEAEMLQGLLTQFGIQSMLKRAGGFDNPEFLSAGPHEVFVLERVADKAREVLKEVPG